MIYLKYGFVIIFFLLLALDKVSVRLLCYTLFLISVMGIDYHIYLRGGKAIFFGDENQIEKDLREIQKLEIKKKLKELNDKSS